MEKKLPVDFKFQWLNALRSGTYRQGDGYLHRNDSFCCLGVAIDLIDNTVWKQANTGVGCSVNKVYGAISGATGYPHTGDLPSDIEEVLGQKTEFPSDTEDEFRSVVRHLAHLNDNGSDFNQIATWIEENL
jgi:hypothetical protein